MTANSSGGNGNGKNKPNTSKHFDYTRMACILRCMEDRKIDQRYRDLQKQLKADPFVAHADSQTCTENSLPSLTKNAQAFENGISLLRSNEEVRIGSGITTNPIAMKSTFEHLVATADQIRDEISLTVSDLQALLNSKLPAEYRQQLLQKLESLRIPAVTPTESRTLKNVYSQLQPSTRDLWRALYKLWWAIHRFLNASPTVIALDGSNTTARVDAVSQTYNVMQQLSKPMLKNFTERIYAHHNPVLHFLALSALSGKNNKTNNYHNFIEKQVKGVAHIGNAHRTIPALRALELQTTNGPAKKTMQALLEKLNPHSANTQNKSEANNEIKIIKNLAPNRIVPHLTADTYRRMSNEDRAVFKMLLAAEYAIKSALGNTKMSSVALWRQAVRTAEKWKNESHTATPSRKRS